MLALTVSFLALTSAFASFSTFFTSGLLTEIDLAPSFLTEMDFFGLVLAAAFTAVFGTLA